MAKRKQAADFDDEKAPAVKIPHDPFNEQVCLAAMLSDKEARTSILTQARPQLFLGDGHSQIYEAIAEIDRRGLKLDAQTLRQIGGKKVKTTYLRDLKKSHPTPPPNLAHHIASLKWDSARAKAVSGPITSLVDEIKNPLADPERIKALARQVPQAFDGHGTRQFLYDSEQLIQEAMTELRARSSGKAVSPYGIEGLDTYPDGEPRMIPGAKRGEITIVTAVSGSGKSTVLARMALGLARQRRKILFGAWEMKAALTLELCTAFSLNWSRSKMAIGKFSKSELATFEAQMRKVSKWIKFWKFPWGRDQGKRPKYNQDVLDKIHGYIADSGCEVAIFDLLHRAFVDRRVDAEEQALEGIQVIADETQVHFIAAHQQRLKDIEKRDNKRPTREGMKGTSSWVDVADTIIGVHLPALWKAIPNDTLELLVLKQRNAPWPMCIEFDWDPDRAMLSNARDIDFALGGSDDDSSGAMGSFLGD